MTSILHVALSLLQLQLLTPRHCHLKMRKSCNMWKWPLKIKQLSLSPCHKERGRNDMLRHRSGQKKTQRCQESSSICGWNWKLECEGGREGKKEGCEVKERDGLNQIRQQRRPSPVIWLEVFWTCCVWRGKHIIICCIPSTHMSQISTGHQRRV